jgi:opacity protein-like surface antigen
MLSTKARFALRCASAVSINLILLSSVFAADMPRRSPPPQIATGQPILDSGGFYIGGRQMLGVTQDTRFKTDDGNTSFKSRYEFGRYTGAVLGYSFGPMFGYVSPRIELEGSFGNLSVDRHTVTSLGAQLGDGKTDSFGELRTRTGLVNGYLDTNLGRMIGATPDSLLWRIKPFVGAGVGASHVTLRRQGVSYTGVVMDGSDTRMTWQVSVGIGYQIFDRTTLDIGFRHQRTEGLSFTARDGTSSKTDLVNNLVTVGLRRSF